MVVVLSRKSGRTTGPRGVVSVYHSVCVGHWTASCFNGDRLLGELTQVSPLRISDTHVLIEHTS